MMEAASEVLRIVGARKRFGTLQALDGVDLQLERGEWLALLGPNGAGKTTLVRSIAGRVELDDGHIELLGERLDGPGAGEARARLGIVPQEIALFRLLSAVENLRAFGELQGLRGAELRERIAWALDWSGLEQRADEAIGNFSGGMKRRLNLAASVLHKPEVVLLDEPTVGVDPQSRQRIWEMLAQLRASGASLVLTTHQLDEAQQVSDRIAIVDQGRVVAGGTLEDLVERELGSGNRFVIRLDRALDPTELNGAGRDLEVDGTELRGRLLDPGRELPALLATLEDAKYRVAGVKVDEPTLHDVFLHLTGRELRE